MGHDHSHAFFPALGDEGDASRPGTGASWLAGIALAATFLAVFAMVQGIEDAAEHRTAPVAALAAGAGTPQPSPTARAPAQALPEPAR
ncbi:MAG: hypothetical protein HY778_18740 [Betaproteobacteria bacterium]|nr:hypothetical protein [Betaproteobacteria bacterium]